MPPIDIRAELGTLLDKMSVTDSNARDYAVRLLERLLDEPSWRALAPQPLKEFLYEGVCFYGQVSWEPLVNQLMPIYSHAMEQMPPAERIDLLAAVRQRVQANQTSMNAFMPFVYVDLDPGVVSTAAADYVVMAAPEEGDPLSWSRGLLANLNAGLGANKGAILGGLVSLGDRHLNALLKESRWLLSDNEIDVASKCLAGTALVGALEFWLEWLEELAAAGLDETTLFHNVAFGLALLPRRMRDEDFIDSTHNFDYQRQAESGAQAVTVHGKHTLAQLAGSYSERLYTLEALEKAPKLMSLVLTDFGLEPGAPFDERGSFQ